MQLIAATDMDRSDENLRHSHTSVCALNHLLAAFRVATDVDLAVVHTFPLQQSLCGGAIRAKAGRIDLDGHVFSAPVGRLLYGGARGRYNPSEYQHLDMGGAGPQQRPGTGVDRCTGREYIVDKDHTPAGNVGLVLGRHTEGALYIVSALGFRPTDLLRRGSHAFEPGVNDRHTAENRD